MQLENGSLHALVLFPQTSIIAFTLKHPRQHYKKGGRDRKKAFSRKDAFSWQDLFTCLSEKRRGEDTRGKSSKMDI